jgi:hypothetical protein
MYFLSHMYYSAWCTIYWWCIITKLLCPTVIYIPIIICHSTTVWIAVQFGYQLWEVDCVWNVVAYTQKPHFVFQRKGRVHLNWRGRQFSRLLAAEVCASAVVMLHTPCSEVVWRVLATRSVRQFPLHFPSCMSPCAITFQLDFTLSDHEANQEIRETLNVYASNNIVCGGCKWTQSLLGGMIHLL